MQIIATGFDSFHKHKSNPSQDTVELLPDFVKIDDKNKHLSRVIKLVLPTSSTRSWRKLDSVVTKQSDKPFLLLLTGMAESRDRICLERFALNVRQYRIPDNDGKQPYDEYIEKKAAEAYRSQLPLQKLEQELFKAGFLCDVSNSAGTFVCNDIYFQSLHKWQDHKQCRGVLFIHLPPPQKYLESLKKAKLRGKSKKTPLQHYADCLATISKLIYGKPVPDRQAKPQRKKASSRKRT